MQQKVKLRYGQLCATELASHNSLVMVVSAALGGSKPAGRQKDVTKGHKTLEGAVAAINTMLGGA